MKISLIPPIDNLDYVKRGDIAMALTHLIHSNPEYAKFYKKLKLFKILDNSAYEDQLCDIDRVLEAAELIGANEVILPDVVLDGQATIELTEAALSTIRKKRMMRKYRWLAVPQGKTEEEWWNCFQYFNRHSSINTIGFSKLSCPTAFENTITNARLEITSMIEKAGIISGKKEYHLLGGSYEILKELLCQPHWIRSIDTSAPFEYAKHFKKLDCVKVEPKKKADLSVPLEPQHLQYVEHNLNLMFNRSV